MAKQDLTINSYHSLSDLERSIRAFVEFAHIMPEEDTFAPLLLVLADRIEGDFSAVKNDTIRLWSLPDRQTDSLSQ